MDRPVFALELANERLGIDLETEVVVEEPDDLAHVVRCVVDQLGCLGDRHRPEGEEESEGCQDQDRRDRSGRVAAPPAPARESVDGGFERE